MVFVAYYPRHKTTTRSLVCSVGLPTQTLALAGLWARGVLSPARDWPSLLATVASLTRQYPGTIYVAVGSAAALMLWTLVWVTAVSYTSQFEAQASVLVLLLLSIMWVTQLLRAVVNATVAGTVASWYFLSPHVPPRPTARALQRALTTSFGSLCLGALLAASLKTMRAAAKGISSRSAVPAGIRSCALCVLGFLDVCLALALT